MSNVGLGGMLELDGGLELPELSDDELAALFPLAPPAALLVPLTTHEGLSDDERLARGEAGEASLVERRLLLEADDRVALSDELQSILRVREAPVAVTLIDIVEGETVRSRVAYGTHEAGVLLTEIVNDAAHAFAVRSAAEFASAIADEIDPDCRVAAEGGAPLIYTANDHPASWSKVEEAAANAERSVRLYAAQGLGDEGVRDLETSVVVSPDAVWVIGGVIDTQTGDGTVHARQLSRAGLEELLLAFLQPGAA